MVRLNKEQQNSSSGKIQKKKKKSRKVKGKKKKGKDKKKKKKNKKKNKKNKEAAQKRKAAESLHPEDIPYAENDRLVWCRSSTMSSLIEQQAMVGRGTKVKHESATRKCNTKVYS